MPLELLLEQGYGVLAVEVNCMGHVTFAVQLLLELHFG